MSTYLIPYILQLLKKEKESRKTDLPNTDVKNNVIDHENHNVIIFGSAGKGKAFSGIVPKGSVNQNW